MSTSMMCINGRAQSLASGWDLIVSLGHMSSTSHTRVKHSEDVGIYLSHMYKSLLNYLEGLETLTLI